MQKAYLLFGEAASGLQDVLATGNLLQQDLLLPSPKIARGENYKGLPYVMLDYPRHFSKEDTFAFRTMFWWGNFLSFTWHLKGSYAAHHGEIILTHHKMLANAGFQVCISENEWQHEFEADNYRPMRDIYPEELSILFGNRGFIKLAVKIPLDRWNYANEELMGYYSLILELI